MPRRTHHGPAHQRRWTAVVIIVIGLAISAAVLLTGIKARTPLVVLPICVVVYATLWLARRIRNEATDPLQIPTTRAQHAHQLKATHRELSNAAEHICRWCLRLTPHTASVANCAACGGPLLKIDGVDLDRSPE